MKQNLVALTLAAVCGALLLHCGGGAVNDLLDGSFVDDASGQPSGECCEPAAPEFTVIAEAALTDESPSAEFDVRGYREVVIYATGELSSNLCTFAEVRFRASSAVAYGMTAQPDLKLYYSGAGSLVPVPGARMRVDGTHMQITGVGCDTAPRTIVVAGVR